MRWRPRPSLGRARAVSLGQTCGTRSLPTTIPRRRGVAASHHTTPREGRDARGSLCPQAPRAIVAFHRWARCPWLPCCRPVPPPPRWPLSCAVSRTRHSTPSSGTRIAHSMPPNGAGVGICAVARRCRATQCYRMAHRPRTRRYRVVRPGTQTRRPGAIAIATATPTRCFCDRRRAGSRERRA